MTGEKGETRVRVECGWRTFQVYGRDKVYVIRKAHIRTRSSGVREIQISRRTATEYRAAEAEAMLASRTASDRNVTDRKATYSAEGSTDRCWMILVG